MTTTKYVLSFLFLSLALSSCKGQTQTTDPAQNNTANQDYTYKTGSINGIGKWYLGREMAHVMGFQGMEWLERPEREQEESTSLLLKNMDIQPEDIIADIGAGSGYHVFKMAPVASAGQIYAVDIQPEMLEEMSNKKQVNGIKNINLIQGSEQSVHLPENTIDKILMVDVYHEFNYPIEMIDSMRQALKKDGEIYLIEYRGEDPNIPIKTIHKMTEAQSVKEFEANGFKLKENMDNLPWQHCMVFVKK